MDLRNAVRAQWWQEVREGQGPAAEAMHWLAHCPARLMFPAGLALGCGVGAIGLLGSGGWWGVGLGVLFLGAVALLGPGAEPVRRQTPTFRAARRSRPPAPAEILPPISLPEKEPFPAEPVRRLVEDIPGLLAMMELPGGTFRMGSADDDAQAYRHEKPQHAVTVSSFAIGCTPVTRQLYQAIMADTPWLSRRDATAESLPATDVRWFDAIAFCNALSERQGLQMCYGIHDTTVTWDPSADGYRLPTEAEWEYAARAGTETRWLCGDTADALGDYAWFADNAADRVHAVGSKASNPWGLYDMVGNVWEWCWDWYGDYAAEAVMDPPGPAAGAFRVLRGGAYWNGAWDLRSAFRDWSEPECRRRDVGFRVVRRPRRQP